MTDATLESRITELLSELRAVKAAPRTILPDGTPGPVAPGELIESSWGNAVADAIARHPYNIHGGFHMVTTTSSGTGQINLPFAAVTANVTIDRETQSYWITSVGRLLIVSAELSTDGTDIDMTFLSSPVAGGALTTIGPAVASIGCHVIATWGLVMADSIIAVIFGDADPEDQYDRDDPIPVRLAILERVITSIAAEGDTPRRYTRIADALRLVALIAAELGDYGERLEQIEDALNELGDD